jgi:hypothetical protein
MSAIAAAPTTVANDAVTPRILRPNSPRLSHESRIRRRLLHKLGIEPKQSIQKRIRPKPVKELHSINYFKTVSAPFLQPLQDSIGVSPPTSTVSSSFFSSVSPIKSMIPDEKSNPSKVSVEHSKISSVRFDDDVLVVPVPSRHAYSDRIKKTIWRDAGELREIVNRNRYEYTFEGWDSSKVLEDDDMYVDIATGEKVHPCWVETNNGGDEDGGEIDETENTPE